tara:strand:- start:956 stop:1573 length:618 start_codon:yes stop_codon:yes gene_type:complete
MGFETAGAVTSVIGSGLGAIQANRAQKRAEALERERRAEMERLKSDYLSLDTSNPYLNMENTMEDLTVNQQQSQFQGEQFQQSQANILSGMRGAAGGSGIAALAQSLAQQGQIASQQSSADIGRQEANNQNAAARQAAALQYKEREGDMLSRGWERDQVGTALGMSQAETAAARQEAMMAEQAKWDAIQGGVSGLTDIATAGIGS